MPVEGEESDHVELCTESRSSDGNSSDTDDVEDVRTDILQKAMQESSQRGVVYLSRIPPHMRPQKMRHLLEKHGEINRLYLAPEDPGVRKKRRKLTGRTGKYFNEGWVEFASKKDAKKVAAILNGTPIGGKVRSDHYYDLWTIKYLPKFKWDHLTEEIMYQKAIREQKMANEIAAAKRERDFYLSRVDKAKGQEAQKQRKKKREVMERERHGDGGSAGVAQSSGGDGNTMLSTGAKPLPEAGLKVLRTYRQKEAKADAVTDKGAHVLSGDVLALIGGKKKRPKTA